METMEPLMFEERSTQRNMLKILLAIALLLLLTMNIVETIFGIHSAEQQQLKDTPSDFCPVSEVAQSSVDQYQDYYEEKPGSSVRLRFCYGPDGPVVELRTLLRSTVVGGVNLNPYQFRKLFSNLSEIFRYIDYIPPVALS